MRHFRDFGIEPTRIGDGILEIETSDWYYSIRIIDRRDVNKDGIEDLLIDFYDQLKFGTYRTLNRHHITRYSSRSNLVAIAF